MSPKLGYVFHIRALARLISASSKEKYFALIFLFKFEVKFVNLTHRDPYLENVNLKTWGEAAPNLTCTKCSNISRAVGLERVWERKGRRFVSRIPFLSRKKEKESSFASATLRNYKAERNSSPFPLNKKIKILKIRQNSAENLHSNLSLQNPSQKHQI